MFLTKDNHIKWKFLGAAGGIVAALCFAGALGLDRPIYNFLHQFNWQIWNAVAVISDEKVWLAGSFIIAAIIFIKKEAKTKQKQSEITNKFNFRQIIVNFIEKSKDNKAFLIFCSIALSCVVAAVLKFGFGRMRPVFYEALGRTGFYPFTNDWAFNSLPSGHTAASFAGLVMLGLLFPKIKPATWTIAVVVGLSRVMAGAHWASDVLLGAFIGMVAADVVFRLKSKN
ncbi:MAG: phosphatase PAP2 family protein [Rickettsiales bacterium]|jgi:membrane-associated phospholipid phosphatase|nr:phosphatase PAP2 family protein [Rickettsiales bacterium]